ncbi:MAG: protein translocase subunit SecD, partial [Deltaproteobacteria bacterium]
MKTLSWRLISVLVVIAAAFIFVLPTIRPGMWPHKKINLGLDLQGGMHLVLEVDTDKAVEDTI